MSSDARQRGAKAVRLWLGAMAVVCLTACISTPPPVQEMSDARQAVEAAREAGAEQYAPQDFQRSVNLLEKAQTTLERGSYKQAKNQALAARRHAMEALEKADRQSRRGQ